MIPQKRRPPDHTGGLPQNATGDGLFSGSFGSGLFGGSLFSSFGSSLLGSESLGSSDLLGLDACLFFGNSLTLVVVQLARTRTGVFNDTCSLAAQVAQVVELGATDLTATNDFNAFTSGE